MCGSSAKPRALRFVRKSRGKLNLEFGTTEFRFNALRSDTPRYHSVQMPTACVLRSHRVAHPRCLHCARLFMTAVKNRNWPTRFGHALLYAETRVIILRRCSRRVHDRRAKKKSSGNRSSCGRRFHRHTIMQLANLMRRSAPSVQELGG